MDTAELLRSAKHGNPEAQFQYGAAMEAAKDMKKAMKWYKKAAKIGHAGALNGLGNCYTALNDPAKAKAAYQEAASSNYPNAFYHLGLIALFEKNEEAARENLHQAVERGQLQAVDVYLELLFKMKRYDEAEKQLRILAEQEYAPAWRKLGELGRLRNQQDLVIEGFSKADETGDLFAAFELVSEYERTENLVEARKWAKRAEENGDERGTEAYERLSVQLPDSEATVADVEPGTPETASQADGAELPANEANKEAAVVALSRSEQKLQDMALAKVAEEQQKYMVAIEFYEKYPEDATANYAAAKLLQRMPDGQKRMFPFLERAAEGDISEAQYDLAVFYDARGESEAAEKWYQLAAEHGYADATVKLAKRYKEKGEAEKSRFWLKQAASAGFASAQYELGLYYREQDDQEQAKHYFLQAAAYGDMHARYFLGELYQKAGDLEQAKHWYDLAAQNGTATIQHNVGIFLFEQGETDQALTYFMAAARKGLAASQEVLQKSGIDWQ